MDKPPLTPEQIERLKSLKEEREKRLAKRARATTPMPQPPQNPGRHVEINDKEFVFDDGKRFLFKKEIYTLIAPDGTKIRNGRIDSYHHENDSFSVIGKRANGTSVCVVVPFEEFLAWQESELAPADSASKEEKPTLEYTEAVRKMVNRRTKEIMKRRGHEKAVEAFELFIVQNEQDPKATILSDLTQEQRKELEEIINSPDVLKEISEAAEDGVTPEGTREWEDEKGNRVVEFFDKSHNIYDDKGTVVCKVHPDGERELYMENGVVKHLNEKGELVKTEKILPDGTVRTYNLDGILFSEVLPDGTQISYIYDESDVRRIELDHKDKRERPEEKYLKLHQVPRIDGGGNEYFLDEAPESILDRLKETYPEFEIPWIKDVSILNRLEHNILPAVSPLVDKTKPFSIFDQEENNIDYSYEGSAEICVKINFETTSNEEITNLFKKFLEEHPECKAEKKGSDEPPPPEEPKAVPKTDEPVNRQRQEYQEQVRNKKQELNRKFTQFYITSGGNNNFNNLDNLSGLEETIYPSILPLVKRGSDICLYETTTANSFGEQQIFINLSTSTREIVDNVKAFLEEYPQYKAGLGNDKPPQKPQERVPPVEPPPERVPFRPPETTRPVPPERQRRVEPPRPLHKMDGEREARVRGNLAEKFERAIRETEDQEHIPPEERQEDISPLEVKLETRLSNFKKKLEELKTKLEKLEKDTSLLKKIPNYIRSKILELRASRLKLKISKIEFKLKREILHKKFFGGTTEEESEYAKKSGTMRTPETELLRLGEKGKKRKVRNLEKALLERDEAIKRYKQGMRLLEKKEREKNNY